MKWFRPEKSLFVTDESGYIYEELEAMKQPLFLHPLVSKSRRKSIGQPQRQNNLSKSQGHVQNTTINIEQSYELRIGEQSTIAVHKAVHYRPALLHREKSSTVLSFTSDGVQIGYAFYPISLVFPGEKTVGGDYVATLTIFDAKEVPSIVSHMYVSKHKAGTRIKTPHEN